ncbi:chromate transporter [Achromobacter ruhlandii]|uniref:chromate transporter n=1 Tax=Achromobacter ruhlandii TaxID=72557 RepID=UPI0006C6B2ED|nr:chromate transporter [Achromobacter ruhlandii]AMG44065.1 chromate transporter [Achromobacter xylosoxidans]CUJ12972.1 chromate transporter%2C chromate ion transporter (CHR) family [Achromobacter ruhlandii]CUJ33264.1 chromate transporter%2C chromate ion transporter (CHR) family [Achromobacter ruhlandii]CUJ99955.1 chromate transporter%2C chromate ion transporter (CHR) family [Achromobacter ruhlandii]
MNLATLHDLFSVFTPLSFLTVGGGQSILPDIHRQAVDSYGWISESQFLDYFALSRITPGPASLLVTLIGWQVGGWLGAMAASIAIFLPCSLLIYALARVWARYRHATCVRAIEAGLVPVAAGMILASSCTVLRAAEGGAWAWGVAAVSTLALVYTRISPFLMLALGALVFLAALA